MFRAVKLSPQLKIQIGRVFPPFTAGKETINSAQEMVLQASKHELIHHSCIYNKEYTRTFQINCYVHCTI